MKFKINTFIICDTCVYYELSDSGIEQTCHNRKLLPNYQNDRLQGKKALCHGRKKFNQ